MLVFMRGANPAAGPDREPIALVADEPSMRRVMRCILQSRGYRCIEAAPGDVIAIARSRAEHAAIIMLSVDVECDVLSDLASLQDTDRPRVLVVGWMEDLPCLARALECGADEYLIKPFTAAEACSRLGLLFAKPGPSAASSNAGAVELTEEEHRGLVALEDKAGRIATFGHLAKRIWGDATARRSDDVRAVMSALRKRIEAVEPHRGFIKTELGMGYRLVARRTSRCHEGAALERRRAYDSSEAGP